MDRQTTIIFDFDGTLADSFSLALEIAYELTGIAHLSEAAVAQLRTMPLMKAVKELHIPITRLPGLILHGRQKMSERIHEVRPFAGIPEALHTLHAGGYHMLVISSNSEQNVRAFLRANDLEKYFDGVYGGVGIFDKAAALRKVLRRNRLQPAACYYVGDESRDADAANRVGVRSVAVTWGYQAASALREHRPFALVDRPVELLELFSV